MLVFLSSVITVHPKILPAAISHGSRRVWIPSSRKVKQKREIICNLARHCGNFRRVLLHQELLFDGLEFGL